MKRIAAYAFSTSISESSANARLDEIEAVVRKWLEVKSQKSLQFNQPFSQFTSDKGNQATLAIEKVTSTAGQLRRWTVTENLQTSVFRTTLAASANNSDVTAYGVLELGPAKAVVAPVVFDARCPHVIRDVLRLPYPWAIGTTRVQVRKVRAIDRASAELLGDMLESPQRSLPIVAIAEADGFLLHPNLDEDLAHDLCGLATVTVLNDLASWTLTRRFGRELSCFSGGVRIYWPFPQNGLIDPRRHPLWTASRLLDAADGDTAKAADLIRSMLRRRIMNIAAFSIPEPAQIQQIMTAHRQEQLDAIKQDTSSLADKCASWEQLAVSYADQVDQLVKGGAQKDEEIERLRVDLQNERLMREYQQEEELVEIKPDEIRLPESIEEAYKNAAKDFDVCLFFGTDAERGIRGLDPKAGPPEKVYRDLKILAEASLQRKNGTLGKTPQEWMSQRGVNCSGESEGTRNDKAARKRRTWKDAEATRYFDFHLKPNDGTSPDKCVRIYCDWDDKLEKFIVGWIGRHPDK
jgi:hypothetical protein